MTTKATGIDLDQYRVRPGRRVHLDRWPTRVPHLYGSKKDYSRRIEAQVQALADLQQVLYADNRYAVLLILQAMDAAGKDGTIRHVMSGVNPQGVQVFSFKHPSASELDHDFLWRTSQCLPERGRIGIFNRSYYEEVLVVRVHPEILAAQALPPEALAKGRIWKDRFRSIVDHEAHLDRNGTRVVKIFLHLSRDEQRERFLARIDEPDKNWKFSEGDVAERQHWDSYRRAYEDCLASTSTAHAPWYVVPADDKENARLIASEVLVATLRGLDLRYPTVSPARRRELQALRRRLQDD